MCCTSMTHRPEKSPRHQALLQAQILPMNRLLIRHALTFCLNSLFKALSTDKKVIFFSVVIVHKTVRSFIKLVALSCEGVVCTSLYTKCFHPHSSDCHPFVYLVPSDF